MRAAARWYAKAARRGDAKAAAIVGACYWNEEGVKRNSGTACRYVRLSTAEYCPALFGRCGTPPVALADGCKALSTAECCTALHVLAWPSALCRTATVSALAVQCASVHSHGMARHGTVAMRHGTAWHRSAVAWHGMAR